MVTVSVIGCGNMGGALVKGLARAGGHEITACDLDPDALAAVEPYTTRTTDDPAEAAADSELVFVAVKPQYVADVLDSLDLTAETTLVTIAAGVETEFVEARTDATVVRIMPNLAAESRDMAAAVAGGTPPELATVLDDVGAYVEVEESLMDTATALNGSSPAFVFYLIKALRDGAVAEGMSESDAEVLAAQTFRGAAETVLRDERSIEELIDAVCSPNGTTIEGMAVLRESDVERDVSRALSAAAERSRELAEEATGGADDTDGAEATTAGADDA